MSGRWSIRVSLMLIVGTPNVQAQSSLARNNSELLEQLRSVHDLNPSQLQRIRAIFAASSIIGQGNPAITQHPDTPQGCQKKLKDAGIEYANPRFRNVCHAAYMAPLYDPKKQQPEAATACIDQFEFPDIPCAYPVVWVKAQEAAQLCAAEGKRMCDANEWEDACQGATEPADYRFDLPTRLRHRQLQVARLQRRQLGPMRLRHLSGRGLSGLPQPAAGV